MPKIVSNVAIHDAIICAISENGYGGATTKRIAELAEVSEVTLFRKYGSKAKMAREAIAELIDRIGVRTAIRYTGDLESDLVRVVGKYLEMVREYGQFLIVLLSDIPRHDELKELVESPAEIMSSFSDVIVRYQQEGALRDEEPMLTVTALVGPLMYGTLLARTGPLPPITSQQAEEYVAAFLDGRRG